MDTNTDVILLVGGKSSRYNSESDNKDRGNKPKSFHKIKNKYLIIHCMENFINYGFYNFILPIGYYEDIFKKKFKEIKFIKKIKCNTYFDNKEYIKKKNINKSKKEINILLLKTYKKSNKSERIIRVVKKLNIKKLFVSYGDGVGDLDIKKLYESHTNNVNNIMTVASLRPYSQYGHFFFKKNKVINFIEKPQLDKWVNIGYFYLNIKSIKFIEKFVKKDLEMGALKHIAKIGKLNIYKHKGFWKSVDTLKDAIELNNLLAKIKK